MLEHRHTFPSITDDLFCISMLLLHRKQLLLLARSPCCGIHILAESAIPNPILAPTSQESLPSKIDKSTILLCILQLFAEIQANCFSSTKNK